ncbi:alpha-mannosidase [Cladochytrium replicatum]|nr:alpha-mannosidase [Cladochytrium replicatum]
MATTTAGTRHLNTMQKHRNITIERIEKFLQEGQFDDVNLRSFFTKKSSQNAVALEVYSVPDLKRITFEEATRGRYRPAQVGESFGPSWSTHWFKAKIDIPKEWHSEEVNFVFDPGCEAMVWSTNGEPLQGITGGRGVDRHVEYRLTRSAQAGEHYEFLVEVACNGMFGNGQGGLIEAPDPYRQFRLDTAEIAVRNSLALALWRDLEILHGIIKEFPNDSQINADALYTANAVVNTVYAGRKETIDEARKLTKEFFEKRKEYGKPDHLITAIGNCHIDTAWLWPYDETKRKVARSWSRQCGLLDDYPHYTFTASQAQQFEWLEKLYPSLFERVKAKAADGNFIPIGGTWVEMDCNLPSGEGLVRQFLYGQRYFESKFGERCTVFWLPDTFGYSAQLPQIVKQSCLKYFFTQKLSWNNINKFPHSTFKWIGLDGTDVLTHFSPADTYTAQADVANVAFMVRNNKDKEYSNRSLLVYGNGDGGGGPLSAMIERIDRMSSVQGFPAVVNHGNPNKFFEELDAGSRGLTSWKGELYFELHRGTYTSQAKTKKYNRSNEYLLQKVETLSALCLAEKIEEFSFDKEEIDRLWKLVLLNQFHDVLPGSSIELVFIDAVKFHLEVDSTGSLLRENAFEALVKFHAKELQGEPTLVVFNPTSWRRAAQLVEVEVGELRSSQLLGAGVVQKCADPSKVLAVAENLPSYGLKSFSFELRPNFQRIKVRYSGIDPRLDSYVIVGDDGEIKEPLRRATGEDGEEQLVIIETEYIHASFDWHGRLVSLVDVKNGNREAIGKGERANVFKLFDDVPLFWDAWDVEVYHLEKGWDATVGDMIVEEYGPLRVVLRVEHPISAVSTIVQRIIITAISPVIEFDTVVNWHENRTILKVEFPVAITRDYATYEVQFGYVQRPTHYNTSWDLARFEVCGHKFADISEPGYGVALLTDSKFGYSVHQNVMRISLLKSSKAPDFNADMGEQRFRYGLYPHTGMLETSDVVQVATEFNIPVLTTVNAVSSPINTEYFSINSSTVVLDTVKPAEPALNTNNKTKDHQFILRLYEAYGARGLVRLASPLKIKDAWFTNMLEDRLGPVQRDDEGSLLFNVTPFQVVTIGIAL